jgi:hypothetical protein
MEARMSCEEKKEMIPRETLSYLVMFCALLLVRSTKATFEDSLHNAPLEGGAHRLAAQLRLLRHFEP